MCVSTDCVVPHYIQSSFYILLDDLYVYVVTRELDLVTSSSCDISFHLATCKIFTRNLAIVVRLFEVGSDTMSE